VDKPLINVSLNPTYYCNFSCDFCYLTPEQLNDKTTLDLERLEELLMELSQHRTIDQVDLYGGEVLLLSESYHKALRELLGAYGCDDISLITNLSTVNSVALDPTYILTVSYDFEAREKADRVFNNLLTLPREFSILTLVSRAFLDTVTPDEYVHTFNLLTNMTVAELKPYSKNQANQQPVTNREFEQFVYAVLTHPDRQFHLENQTHLEQVLEGTHNSFSDDHVYITPAGNFAVLEFDKDNRELFLELDSFEDYLAWCTIEQQRVVNNSVCGSCQFFGKCLSEHLREEHNLLDSCNGFHDLIVRWSET